MTIEVNPSVGLNKNHHQSLKFQQFRFIIAGKKVSISAVNYYDALERVKQIAKQSN